MDCKETLKEHKTQEHKYCSSNVLLTAQGYASPADMTSGHTADMTAEHIADVTSEHGADLTSEHLQLT